MAAAVVQFVDSIAAAPGLRLNLNSAPWTTLATTNLGFPELRYATTSNMLTDGDQIVASALGNRVLELRLQVHAATGDEAATQLQLLIRELNRPRNILKVLLAGATTPVFMRTWRSSPADWAIHTDGSFIDIAANVPAEPTAYGLLETPVSAATLNTDPALSNGHFVDVTGVRGDVETPVLIRWPAASVAANRETVFAMRRRGTPSAQPFIFQAENQTNGTDTADTVNASFSNGNGIRTTFATVTTMATRSTISDLGTAGVDLRGRYRVFARYAKTTSGDNIDMQIQWGTSGGTVTTNDPFDAPTGTGIFMADLGEIQVPRGVDPITADDGVEIPASDTYHFAFQASRTGGAGNLDVDYFIFVPSDDHLGIVKWVEAGPSYWKLNGRDNGIYAFNGSDQIATAATPGLSYGLPMLTPNQTNRLYMVYEVGRGLTTTLTTVTVTVQYYPRYLVGGLRPVST